MLYLVRCLVKRLNIKKRTQNSARELGLQKIYSILSFSLNTSKICIKIKLISDLD